MKNGGLERKMRHGTRCSVEAGEEDDDPVLRDGHPFVLMTPFDDDDLARTTSLNPRELAIRRRSHRP